MKSPRALRPLALLACLATSLASPSPGSAFSFEDVAARAEALAREEYRDHRGQVPDWMLVGRMTYDQWRDIRYRPERALWKKEGLPFQVQLFHPGLYYDRTVAVSVVEKDAPRRLEFDSSAFDYGKNDFAAKVPKGIGYAGIRIHAPMKSPAYFDELIVFLGATYFRALGRDNVYGLSARGIAVDTVEAKGEEFPHFVEFWLVRPEPSAGSLVIFALMEGPSVTGAYRFEVYPGSRTRVEVRALVFARRDVAKLGLAPLTSMFFFGENTRRKPDDFRPEVHDSDGLLLHLAGGEWLWRPLENRVRVSASGFAAENPRGFGLVQRDRDFVSYQDLETRAELRPSAWVEPRGDWGKGRIELVEIPTTTELVDNIVAYWVPEKPLRAGGRAEVEYTVSFYSDDPATPPAGRVLATRQDGGDAEGKHRFVIDFAGGELSRLPAERPPTARIDVAPKGAAKLLDHHVVANPATGGWRLSFQLEPKTEDPIELRAFLAGPSGALTETWSYGIVLK